MMRIPIEKNALSVVETRKKIRSFEKQARRLRGSIWYHETQRGLADFLAAQVDPHPHKDTGTVSALATLAGSLDDVIANCDLAAARLAGPEEQVEDGFVFTVLAIALRRICKANGLPFKIRKDSDKMKQHSPFSRFIDTLQERLALHPSVSMDAMAARIHRLEKRLPKRDRCNIKN